MPYWSSSRVGPVGPSTNSTGGGGNNGSSKPKKGRQPQKKKGITMEDLKKQTALRLAHERRNDVAVATDTSFASSSSSSGNNNNSKHQNTNITLLSNITTPQKLAPPAPPPPPPILVVPPPPPTAPVTKPQVLAQHAGGGDSSEMGANPKLPHGLTVQELKEMTKARLQAEAAEFVPSSVVTITTMNHLQQQQQQHSSSLPSPIHHHLHQQQQQHSTMPPPPPPHIMQHLSQPSTLSLRSTGSMTVSSQPSQLSLNNTLTSVPPPGFRHNTNNMNCNSNASDNWENASVSTAASGSRLSDIDSTIPFCRSASYPNQYQYQQPPMRQRAATLSPRPYAPARSQHPGSDLSAPPAPPTSTSDNNRARTSSLPIDLVPGLHITWGAFSDTANATMSFFSCDAGIVNNDDLASILKLSGAEEDDDDIDDTMDDNLNHNEFRAD